MGWGLVRSSGARPNLQQQLCDAWVSEQVSATSQGGREPVPALSIPEVFLGAPACR